MKRLRGYISILLSAALLFIAVPGLVVSGSADAAPEGVLFESFPEEQSIFAAEDDIFVEDSFSGEAYEGSGDIIFEDDVFDYEDEPEGGPDAESEDVFEIDPSDGVITFEDDSEESSDGDSADGETGNGEPIEEDGIVFLDDLPVEETMSVEDPGFLLFAAESEPVDIGHLLKDVLLFKDDVEVPKPWAIIPGELYNLRFVFGETNGDSTQQFVDDDTPMVFNIPEGLNLGTEPISDVFAIDLGVDGLLGGNTWSYDPTTNQVTLMWNTAASNFGVLVAAGDAVINVNVTSSFESTSGRIIFTDGLEVEITRYHLATVVKSGTYDASAGVISYTVSVSSVGDSSNVSVSDFLDGSILNYQAGDTVTWTSNVSGGSSGTYVLTADDVSGKSFSIPIGDMADGEEVQIIYQSHVDYSAMQNYVADSTYDHVGFNVSTEDETSNTAVVSADDQADQSSTWATTDITSETLRKSGSWSVVDDNTRRVHWTVMLNEEATVSMAGKDIVDSLVGGGAYASYDTSTPLSIIVRDRNGSIVETRLVPWTNVVGQFSYVSSTSEDRWTYTFPAGDGLYSYQFEYDTLVDVTGLSANIQVSNRVTVNSHNLWGSVSVPAGTTRFYVSKGIDREAAGNNRGWDDEYEYWTITITVPAVGSNEAHLWDLLPAKRHEGSYLYDEFDWTYGDNGFIVTGLLPGETFDVSESFLNGVDKSIKLDFYKDAEKTQRGFQSSDGSRVVTIRVRTIINQDWIDAYPNIGNNVYNNGRHQNRVWFYANSSNPNNSGGSGRISSQAEMRPYAHRPLKTGSYIGTAYVDGVDYPVFEYCVNFQGIADMLNSNDDFIAHDVFDTNILRYLDVNDSIDYNILSGLGLNMNTVERLLGQGKTDSANTAGRPATWNTADQTFTFHFASSLAASQIPSGGYSNARDRIAADHLFYYYMIVKDEAALRVLQRRTDEGSTAVILDNTVSCPNDTNSTASVSYVYKPVNKAMTSYDSSTRRAHYRIVVNEAMDTLNDGRDMTLTDSYSGSSVDFSSVHIETEPVDAATGISWYFSSNIGTFVIPDTTKVVIEYDVVAIGRDGDEVELSNTATLGDYTDSTSGVVTVSSSGSGTAANYRLNLLKYQAGNMSRGLGGAVFQLYKAGDDEWNHENGRITGSGTPMTFRVAGTSEDAYARNEGVLSHVHSAGDFVYFMTDTDGWARISLNQSTDGISLEMGSRYFLVEVEPPSGYVQSDVKWSFQIEDVADYSKLVYFTNDILAIANEPVTETDVFDITFGKQVEGSMGSRDKYFKFTVTLSGVDAGETFVCDISNADATVVSTSSTRAGYVGEENPSSILVPNNATSVSQVFYLQHGQSVTIEGVPAGTGYVIAEDPEDYRCNKIGGSVSGSVTDTDVTETFVNTRDGVVPTGVYVGTLAHLFMCLVGIGLTIVSLKKKSLVW